MQCTQRAMHACLSHLAYWHAGHVHARLGCPHHARPAQHLNAPACPREPCQRSLQRLHLQRTIIILQRCVCKSCHEGLRNDNGRQTLTASIETCIQPVPPRMTAEYASVSVMPKQHLQLPPSTVIQLLQAAWSNAGCFASELSGKENGKEERWVEGVCRR